MKACFTSASILLPAEDIDLHRWSVIACDQYTSQPEYWKQVETITRGVPSTYRLIYPEAYLGEEDNRIDFIHNSMACYLREGILEERVHHGFVLTVRSVGGRARVGLVGAVDLEQYEFVENVSAPIRATEGTILSRIPSRVRIRENSVIESPHAMLLLEDESRRLIEPLYNRRENLKKLYDFDLMLGGGHICGFAVEGEDADRAVDVFARMQAERKEPILAVGDGNHSIASAKAYWSGLKDTLTSEEKKTHPARYALAEIVNLYSDAISFEPIHRIVFGAAPEKLAEVMMNEAAFKEAEGQKECAITICGSSYNKVLSLTKGGLCTCVEEVQRVLECYAKRNERLRLDYIHGERNLMELLEREKEAAGIILEPMKKEELFPIIRRGKILPRKAFSMGEAEEKRYYLECRRIFPID